MSARYSASPAVFTYRWACVKALPPTVVPVRISLGGPRFIAGAARFPAIHELMPRGLFRVDDRAEFTRRFFARLDTIGVDVVQQRFDELHAAFGDRPLALCCFEDLTRPREWCHRRTWADYWRQRTGAVVHDLQFVELNGKERG